MNYKALDQLKKVIEIEGIDRKNGRLARQEALVDWINTWVVEISISQPIIKKKLTGEDQALITGHILEKISETIYNESVKVEQTPKLIKVEGLVIRR